MEQNEFYDIILAPVVESLGSLDAYSMTAIVGFWAGGPISLRTIGRSQREPFVTYVTCELAVGDDQVPSDLGRYELLITCDDEHWAWTVLTKIGRMTTEVAFGSGHTLDIGPWVNGEDYLQGIAFETLCDSSVGEQEYAVFRLHGLNRDELNIAIERGVDEILTERKRQGIYPRTHVPQPHKRLEL